MAGCDESEQHQRFRRLRHNPVPEFKEWQVWEGDIKSGYFYSEDLRGVRAELLAEGHQPRVSMRGLCEWSALPGRTQPGPAAGKAGGHPEPAGPANHSTTLESRFCRYVYQNYTQAAASRLPAAEVGSRPTLPGHRCVPLPKETAWPTLASPCPSFVRWTASSPRRRASWRDLMWVTCPATTARAFVGRGWYAKPICAYMLEAGLAQWQQFKWSLDATAHVDQQCLEQVLQRMEHNMARGRGALRQAGHQQPRGPVCSESRIGLFHEDFRGGLQLAPDLHGCGRKKYWDHVFVTELLLEQQLSPSS